MEIDGSSDTVVSECQAHCVPTSSYNSHVRESDGNDDVGRLLFVNNRYRRESSFSTDLCDISSLLLTIIIIVKQLGRLPVAHNEPNVDNFMPLSYPQHSQANKQYI